MEAFEKKKEDAEKKAKADAQEAADKKKREDAERKINAEAYKPKLRPIELVEHVPSSDAGSSGPTAIISTASA